VKPYRHGPLLDSWRFVRAVFRPRSVDPFIGQTPHTIGARSVLFDWSEIAAERGDYAHRFEGYTPYCSPQPFDIEYLPDAYARDAFEHLMRERAVRVGEITALLEADGIDLEPTAGAWATIGDWVARHAEESLEPVVPGRLPPGSDIRPIRPIWHSLMLDLAMLLGEQRIARGHDISWQLGIDTPYTDAHEYGRSPWLLFGPLPVSSTTDVPNRALLMELIKGPVFGVLNDRTRSENVRQGTADAMRHVFGMVFDVPK